MKKFGFILLILVIVLCCVSCAHEDTEVEPVKRYFMVHSTEVNIWLEAAEEAGFTDIEVKPACMNSYSITAFVPQKYSSVYNFFLASKAFGSLTALRFEIEYLLPNMPTPIRDARLILSEKGTVDQAEMTVGQYTRIYHVLDNEEIWPVLER